MKMETMNMKGDKSFTELAIEDPSFILNSLSGFEGKGDSNFILDSLEDYSQTAFFGESLHQSFSNPISDLKRSSETCHPGFDRPKKIEKSYSWDSSITEQLSKTQATFSYLLAFGNSDYKTQIKQETVQAKTLVPFGNSDYKTHIKQETGPAQTLIPFGNLKYVPEAYEGPKTIRTNRNQDHVIAERKRREKLSQKFIELSALVPGLKKMDKASILGSATKYLKQLLEQVKALEEQARKNTTESAIFVKRHELYDDGSSSSSEKNFSGDSHNELLPEIEARVCDGNVLIRIHCEKRQGIVERTIMEIEKHHLSVINSSVLSFGCSILDITVIAEMDTGFTVSIEDLAKHLTDVFKLFK